MDDHKKVTTMTSTMDAAQTAKQLDDLMQDFEKAHPAAIAAMRVMNISFAQYLQALAALQAGTSLSGNATQR